MDGIALTVNPERWWNKQSSRKSRNIGVMTMRRRKTYFDRKRKRLNWDYRILAAKKTSLQQFVPLLGKIQFWGARIGLAESRGFKMVKLDNISVEKGVL